MYYFNALYVSGWALTMDAVTIDKYLSSASRFRRIGMFKRPLYWIAIIIFSSSLNAETFQLKTENYPPFNMHNSNSRIVGVSTDIIRFLFRSSKINFEMELMSWQRAYKLALEKENYAVFSTTQTPERQDLFKWVGPIISNKWVFLKKGSSPL